MIDKKLVGQSIEIAQAQCHPDFWFNRLRRRMKRQSWFDMYIYLLFLFYKCCCAFNVCSCFWFNILRSTVSLLKLDLANEIGSDPDECSLRSGFWPLASGGRMEKKSTSNLRCRADWPWRAKTSRKLLMLWNCSTSWLNLFFCLEFWIFESKVLLTNHGKENGTQKSIWRPGAWKICGEDHLWWQWHFQAASNLRSESFRVVRFLLSEIQSCHSRRFDWCPQFRIQSVFFYSIWRPR